MKGKILINLYEIINERITNAKIAMERAQESANSEGKSSAGDKYETSRAMGQIDRDMYARQLDNAQNEKAILDKIDLTKPSISIGLGSLAHTSAGYFFLSISAGKIEIEGQMVMAVSPNSPIGIILKGKKVGDGFIFLGKEQLIISII
ncbi:MAG: hypothetical protein V4683_02590 [Bacteroidota bacterium]